MSLWRDFITNDDKRIHKRVHYFPIYERHLSWYRDKSLMLLEIGVARGGSLQMWQRYFGPLAKIVGIDNGEECKDHEAPGIFVRIGDQGDTQFLHSVVDEFGIPDIVIDDGSHRQDLTAKSFEFLYPLMPKNAVYMVEDAHTSYWSEFGGGLENPGTFINRSKECIDRLNADNSRGQVEPNFITRETFGISFYDSVVVFEKGDVWRKEPLRTGKKGLFGHGWAR
jgi:hypothetical protein